jgi:hypothetical protein
MNIEDRFVLAPDASKITDKQTGRSHGKHEVMRILSAKEEDQHMRQNRHPMLARDEDPSMPPRGGSNYQDSSDNLIDADDAIQFVRMLLAKFDPGEREQFLMKLTDLVSTTDANGNGMDGVPANNLGALDRRRRFRRSR